MKRLFIHNILLLLLYSNMSVAAIPEGYYNAADAKNTNQLRLALKDVINHRYNGISYSGLWSAYADKVQQSFQFFS